MAEVTDGLEELDQGGEPGPAATVPGASTTPRVPPGGDGFAPSPASGESAATGTVTPRRGRGGAKKKRPSGAEFRRRRAAALAGEAPPPPQEPARRPEKPAAPRAAAEPATAAEEDPAALELARKTIEDPATLDFIEGLYRMPFAMWATAVKVDAVIPDDERVQRAAKLIRQCMQFWGPKAWMKYLPFVFLACALGEDVVRGVKAVKEARAEEERRHPAARRVPVLPPPAPAAVEPAAPSLPGAAPPPPPVGTGL